MCGLVAILARDGKAHLPRLATALALLQRRGPDAIGQLIRWDGALALGHRLLSIMDSDRSAAQPMVDPETESAIIFNGAIYNFPELRQELTADGIRFRTSGDTEVLLAAWRKWGKGAFARLNGIWSIIIHDQREDCLIVSRDRLGVKPLYLRDDGRTLVLASTIRATLAAAGARAEPDDSAIFDYLLTGQSAFAGRTFHAGVVPVPPGACWSIRRNGNIRADRFHSWEESVSDSPVSAEALRALILDSVRQRLRCAVPAGLLLSGGLDSSIVAWAIGELERSGETATRHFFSYGYLGDNANDETAAAAATLNKLNPNATHDILRVSDQPDPVDIAAMLAGQEEPVSTLSVIATYRLYRHMHEQGFRVAITGEGSDELFGGYTRRYLPLLIRDEVRKGHLWKATHLARSPFLNRRNLANRFAWHLPQPLIQAILTRRQQASSMIAPDFLNRMRPRLEMEIQSRHRSLDDVLYQDVARDLLPMILRYGDRNGMASSIEVRSPFLDYRLVAMALALPSDRKIGFEGGKLILRDAFSGILPDSVVKMPKTFGMGHAEQFSSAALAVQPLLDNPPAMAERYIDMPRLRDCLKNQPTHPSHWWPINLLFFLQSLSQWDSASTAHD